MLNRELYGDRVSFFRCARLQLYSHNAFGVATTFNVRSVEAFEECQ